MPPRVCFVVNPIAGRGRAARIWRRLAPLVSDLAAGQGASYTVKFTEAPRHAEELAREAACEGYDRVADAWVTPPRTSISAMESAPQ